MTKAKLEQKQNWIIEQSKVGKNIFKNPLLNVSDFTWVQTEVHMQTKRGKNLEIILHNSLSLEFEE